MTEVDDVLGLDLESVQRIQKTKKVRGRRDARVCVCGHAGGAHFMLPAGTGLSDDPTDLVKGATGCQAGKVPCACDHFLWVLTATDVRSFIQKTEGPGEEHALTKGVASSLARGVRPEWREGLTCFWCGEPPSKVGTLIAIPYNERGGEAKRSTNENRLHCSNCRALVQRQARGDL